VEWLLSHSTDLYNLADFADALKNEVSTTCVSRWAKEASLIQPLTRLVLTSLLIRRA
jgi:hypothetical protein